MSEYALSLEAAITHEGESYAARCLQVEVASQGESIEEVLVNPREAIELYFEDAPAPEVTDVLVAPLTVRVPGIPAGFHPRSFVEKLLAVKGTQSIRSIDDLAADTFESDEELEDFLAFTYAERRSG